MLRVSFQGTWVWFQSTCFVLPPNRHDAHGLSSKILYSYVDQDLLHSFPDVTKHLVFSTCTHRKSFQKFPSSLFFFFCQDQILWFIQGTCVIWQFNLSINMCLFNSICSLVKGVWNAFQVFYSLPPICLFIHSTNLTVFYEGNSCQEGMLQCVLCVQIFISSLFILNDIEFT